MMMMMMYKRRFTRVAIKLHQNMKSYLITDLQSTKQLGIYQAPFTLLNWWPLSLISDCKYIVLQNREMYDIGQHTIFNIIVIIH